MFNPGHRTRKPSNKINHLSYGVLSLDSKTSKDTNFKHNSHKELKFNNTADNDSGLCSPPLWGTGTLPQSPQRLRSNYKNLSPESKAEAVARGQKELMDMVKNMPESCYELTLKDLVEQRQQQQKQKVEDELEKTKKKAVLARKTNRSGGGGYLLKMGFPFGSKEAMTTTKKKNLGTKVSPRPSIDGSTKGIGFSSESRRCGSKSSSTGSSNSSKSSNRKSSKTNSCWYFLWTKRKEKGE